MSDETTKRVTVYLTDTQTERLEIIKDRRETDNITRTMSWLVDDEWRRIVDHDTKDDKLNRLEAAQAVQDRKINMLLLLAWRAVACDGKVEITAEDVRKLRDLLAEVQL